MSDYDLFVIGGGSGGVRAARIAARHGAKVGLAEADRVGGTCVIRGCVPKKLMVYAAGVRDEIADAPAFGWTVGEASFDWNGFKSRLHAEIDRLNAAYIRNLERVGVELHQQRAVIDGAGRVRLADGSEHSARNILLATGGHPKRADGVAGEELAVTSDAMFTLPQLPHRILIVGAGYVAVEFAGIMAGLGVETTVLHRGGEILRGFDGEIRTGMDEAMRRRGIEIVLEDELAAIEKGAGGLVARTRKGRSIEADVTLLAIGRVPNTSGLGLETVGVALDEYGAISVDAESRTTAPGIFAIGDVTNRLNLTPVAIREGHTLADRLFGGGSAVVDHDDVPHAVFGIPEIGAVGLTEEAASLDYGGLDIYETRFSPMRQQFAGRDEKTLFKLVVDAGTDRVLGCHIMGPGAAEMIQLVAIAVKMGATKADFDATMALHPTAAEELVTMREPTRRVRREAAE